MVAVAVLPTAEMPEILSTVLVVGNPALEGRLVRVDFMVTMVEPDRLLGTTPAAEVVDREVLVAAALEQTEELVVSEPLPWSREHPYSTLQEAAVEVTEATRVLVEVVLEEPVETNPRLQPRDW
jgi:hypothetical protein